MKPSEDTEVILTMNDPPLAVNAEELIYEVQNNNISRITQLVEEHSGVLTHKYGNFENKTILAIACNDQHGMDNITKATIDTLIKLGAKSNEPSEEDHWEPLHYTAINANFEKMSAVVQHLSPEELNSLVISSRHVVQKYGFTEEKVGKTYSNNSLNILLKYGNRKGQFFECCKLLVEKGVDVNEADSVGVTPADLMWKLREERFNQLLRRGVEEDGSSKKYFTLVKRGNVKRFTLMDVTNKEANGCDGDTEDTSSCTLLQLCCAKGLTDCVRFILNKVASPNKVLRKNPEHPVMIAINGDHEEIVRLLLKRTDLVLPEEILLKLQMLYNNKRTIAIVDKYMKMIMKYLRRRETNLQKYLQARDDLERTVLHYAVHYRCTETTLTLLSMGACLINEDIFGYTPLESIETDVLEKFFDSCITTTAEEEDASHTYLTHKKSQQFSVKINYEKLVKEPEEREEESEFLEHMIRVTNLNHLMNHPVVATFLGFKWQKFRWWVYVNLTLYFVAYVSLLVDGFLYLNNVRSSVVPLAVAYVFLLVRDFIQILLLRWNYIKRVENTIDVLLMVAITYIMVISWYPNFHDRYFFIACSIVLLTSTLGIFIQLGSLSYFTIKVTMLKQISVNFFKAMAFYMIPVLAFFFCFFMLMQEEGVNESTDKSFFGVLYNTLTMSSGDSDSDFPGNFGSNVVFAKILYILFVVVIVIILQNLLIGLAVSDLQDIQNQAKFIRNKEQAKYILKIEKIVFTQLKHSKVFRPLLSKLFGFLQVFRNCRVLVVQSNDSKYINVREEVKGTRARIYDQDTVKYLRNVFKNMSVNDKPTDELYSNKRLLEKLERLEARLMESLEKEERRTKKKGSEKLNHIVLNKNSFY